MLDRSEGLAFLAGGGELGRLIAGHAWETTPLGPIPTWPQSLKTTVSLIVRSQVPIVLLWGPDGVMIYNDAYSIFADRRHPSLLGANVREGWPEVADFNDNVMKVCLAGGTLAYRDQALVLFRSGRPEQVSMNLDYSPVLDERGAPAGVIAIVVETTAKVAAEAWRKSEIDRQRQMFEQAPGFIALLSGPDHVFELTNSAYRQLIGHRDVIGLPMRQALPDIEGQGFYELLDSVFEKGEPFIGHGLKASVQWTPGAPLEERLLDFVYQPVRDPAGEIIGIFVQGSDVTDRELARREAKQNEARFQTLAQAMPNQVWTARPDGYLDWFNAGVYEYSGAAAGALDGEGWAAIVHPDDLPPAVAAWREALSSGRAYEAAFRLRRRDGSFRWHIARAVPICDGTGSILQWIGTNTDIHEQKAASEALHESERRLQLSQAAAGIASLEVDVKSGMVFGSEGLWSIWGLSAREAVHVSVLEGIVLPEDRDVRSNAETRANGTAAQNVEYRIRRPDTGEIRWLSRHIDFVRDATGTPTKMFGVIQDITDRKEAEQRQRILTHELEHRIKNILAMVAAIASQTLRNTDMETARVALTSRLSALGGAHDILNAARWQSASLMEVVKKALAPFPSEQITVTGPGLVISPKMGLSLALAINELATNAVKYGSLSVPEGTVAIDWSLGGGDAGETLTWRWREIGGPPVAAPSRKGFGSFLINRVLAADFEGKVDLRYHADGVECLLVAPVSASLQGSQ